MLVLLPMNSRSDCATTSRLCLQRRPLVRLLFISTKRNLLSDYGFIVIEEIRNTDEKRNVDERLLTREAVWCAQ